MEVRIEGDDDASLLKRYGRDLLVGGAAVADVGDVADICASIRKSLHRAARQALVQEQPDHPAPIWMI
jgi:hypothetical protein